jgi:hypothetical protein
MKKQSLYCSSQSSPFKVRTMRKHIGKTPLNLGLLLNLFIKQILTLVWSTDFGNSQIPNCLHIAYAFEHTAGQQINLFSTQWMIFWFWKNVAKKLDLVTQQNKLLQFTKQLLWQCQEVRANYEGAEHFISKMHKSEWGRVFWINITLLPKITKTWRLSFKYSTCKESMT